MPCTFGPRALRRSVATLLIAAQASLPATARAAEPAVTTTAGPPRPSIVLLPPAITGRADDALRLRLTTDLRGGLARGRLVVLEPPAGLASPCDAPCMARLRAAGGSEHALRTTVTVDDRDYAIHLELVELATGALLAESRAACELCGLSELGAVAADLGALLAVKLEGLTRPPPAIVVTTDPHGAVITIDGVTIGPAPLERALVAGKHRVRASLTGYLPDEREVELVAGVRETLQLSLRRSPRARKARAVGWAALATGVPLVGAGVGLLAIAGRDYPARCDGPDIDREGDCRYVYTTTGSGAALLAAGAVLGVLAAVLLARTRDRGRARRPQAFLAPTAAGLVGGF